MRAIQAADTLKSRAVPLIRTAGNAIRKNGDDPNLAVLLHVVDAQLTSIVSDPDMKLSPPQADTIDARVRRAQLMLRMAAHVFRKRGGNPELAALLEAIAADLDDSALPVAVSPDAVHQIPLVSIWPPGTDVLDAPAAANAPPPLALAL